MINHKKRAGRVARAAVWLAAGTWCASCASTNVEQGTSDGSPPAAPPDSHAVYEPVTEAGDGQAYLAHMEGEWDVTKSFFPRDGGAPRVTHGTCTQHMIQGGKFLESDFVFDDEGSGRTTGMGIIGYDPRSKLFTSIWIDSRSTRFSPRTSAQPFDGSRITLEGSAFGQAPSVDGRKSRTVSELLDGGHVLRHRQWSISPEYGERMIMQLEMVRKQGDEEGIESAREDKTERHQVRREPEAPERPSRSGSGGPTVSAQ